MIRALQKKFVVTAMIAVTVLLLVVLGALNVFNAVSNARQTEFLLDDLGRRQAAFFPRTEDDAPPPAAAGSEPGSGSPGISAEGPPGSFESGRRRGFLDEPMDDNMRMSALYFVADLDDQGRVLRTDVSHIASVSEDEAAELALGLDVEQTGGSVGSYRYKIYPRPEGGYRIVFLDSAVRRNAVTRVVLLSLLAQYLPWVLVPRGTYIYHYFASVPFLILANMLTLNWLKERWPKAGRTVLIVYLVLCLACFVILFPYASGFSTSYAWLDFAKQFLHVYYALPAG